MNTRDSLKDATTFAVGVPLFALSVAAATLVLAIDWLGVKAIDRVTSR